MISIIWFKVVESIDWITGGVDQERLETNEWTLNWLNPKD